jgi:drug/metabolite transporter (DMT)-like permease
MATEQPPTPPPGPPPQPAPGASRDEWRAWRHQQHDYWREHGHSGGWYGPGSWAGPWNWWGGGWFWGAALLVIGLYYLLQNLGLLKALPGDVLWPLLLILFGVYLLLRRGRGWR